MGRFILRSKAVFTGLEDFPRPAAIAVVDKKIQAVLPWDYHRDKAMRTGRFTITEKK